MKKKGLQRAAALAVCALLAVGGAGCASSTQLGKAATPTAFTYEERKNADFGLFLEHTERFAAGFAAKAYWTGETEENFAVAPVSVFMALGLAAECANGETREELLSAMGVSYTELKTHFSALYRSLSVENKRQTMFGKKTTGLLKLTNSIWLDENFSAKPATVATLAEEFFCYSHQADFYNNNKSANRAVSEFVKDATNKLIDEDFHLSKETVFALINTLYLKDIWNDDGDELTLTNERYGFTEADGEREETKLLQGYYRDGRAYDGDGFTSFYTKTLNGYKIKFLLPDEGVRVSQIFTADNIAAANAVEDYGEVDHENRKLYYTRCLFPEYEADYDGDVSNILKDMGVFRLFSKDGCDLSNLTDGEAYCYGVQHVTELEVDRKGIEGAAVTVLKGAGAAGPPEYEEVYLDFVVDRAFGFVLTDPYDVTLFSGVVNEI